MSTTHEVINQSTPFVDVNLFDSDRALRDAMNFNQPTLDIRALSALGAEAGAADTLAHARLANVHTPELRTLAPDWETRVDDHQYVVHPASGFF